MRVIGVDPGYDRCGVAVLERSAAGEVLLHSGCLSSDKEAAPAERICTLGQQFQELLAAHQPDAVALEKLFFNKNQKTAMLVAETRGALLYLGRAANVAVFEYGPQEIKVAVTGYGASDKRAVIEMVRRLVPSAPAAAHDDEYDAIAVGLTCLAHNRHLFPIARHNDF